MPAMIATVLLACALGGAALSEGEMDKLADQIRDGSRADADQAINKITFGGGGNFMTPRLIRILQSSSESGRENAAYVLGFVGDSRAGAALIHALSDEDTAVRVTAATACGRLKIRESGAALTKALSDKASGVRREAANALGLIAYKRAANALLALVKDPDLEIRSTALLAVGRLGNPEAVGRLRELEKDPSETVRLGALRARAMLGDKKARDEVRAQLESSDVDKRRDAIGLIGEVRQDWARDLLAKCLSDAVPEVRLAGARALAQTQDERGIRYLVMASENASDPEEKLRVEQAIEEARVTPEMRKKILAGPRKGRP